MESKECGFCHKPIIRTNRSKTQWENQKTHGMCRGAYNKLENAKNKKPKPRLFKRNGKRMTRSLTRTMLHVIN